MSQGARFRRTLRVVYPLREGSIVLRTEADWSRDILPDSPEEGGHSFSFTVESEKPFLYVKPCLRIGDTVHFPPGMNRLVLMLAPIRPRPIIPSCITVSLRARDLPERILSRRGDRDA